MVSSGVPGNPGFGLLEWKGYGPKANGSEFNIRLIAAFCQAETYDQNTNKNRNFSPSCGFILGAGFQITGSLTGALFAWWVVLRSPRSPDPLKRKDEFWDLRFDHSVACVLN